MGQCCWRSIFVKYHFKTNQGIKNLESQLAENCWKTQIYIEDLHNAIENQEFPSGHYSANYPVCRCVNNERNTFDVTKTVSQKEYPLIEVGTMTLNRNPENYFAEVEQVTFSPGNFALVLKLLRINYCKDVCSLMGTHIVIAGAKTNCQSTKQKRL